MASGFLLIISAPSGTGKSTVCRRLLERDRTLRYSVSCTTRAPRPGETDGRHYFFLSEAEFKRKVRHDEFLEWAVVHGTYYGTPRRFIEREIRAGRVVVLAIDVQGAASIRRRERDGVTVFLLPPSWESLERRLKARRDTRETIERRLGGARAELKRAPEYDYWVVNDSLSEAVRQVECIIAAERRRARRQDASGRGLPELRRAAARVAAAPAGV